MYMVRNFIRFYLRKSQVCQRKRDLNNSQCPQKWSDFVDGAAVQDSDST